MAATDPPEELPVDQLTEYEGVPGVPPLRDMLIAPMVPPKQATLVCVASTVIEEDSATRIETLFVQLLTSLSSKVYVPAARLLAVVELTATTELVLAGNQVKEGVEADVL